MYQDLCFGSFVSNGTSQFIPLAWAPSKFTVNIRGNASGDNWTSTANPGVVKTAFTYNGEPAASAFTVKNTNSAATNTDSYLTTGGFTLYDSSNVPTFPLVTISGITQASPAVITTSAAHGLITGNYVRFINVTGMHQLDTIVFQVIVLSSTTFSIALNTSAFATAGSGGSIQQISRLSIMFPRDLMVTAISQATQAVVTTSFDHGITLQAANNSTPAGTAFVTMNVSSPYGMVQIDNQLVQVVAIPAANQLTLNLNTVGYTAFAYPTAGTVIVANSPPQAVPSGEIGQILNKFTNTSNFGMLLGSAVVGPSTATVYWEAYLGSPPVGT